MMKDEMLMHKLHVLEHMVEDGFEKICIEYPAMREMGGTLFLGKYYARPDGIILMLGINPGIISGELTLNTRLQEKNELLINPLEETNIKYWKNARILFNTTGFLKSRLEKATFSFCCPYRTEEWKGTMKSILLENSLPIMTQMLIDCKPDYIILAGVTSLKLIQSSHLLKPPLQITSESDVVYYDNIYQWKRVYTKWESRDISLLQIPHLSRAHGRQRLEESGYWLDKQIRA